MSKPTFYAFLVLLAFVLSYSASASNFYFSNAGDDSRTFLQAQNPATSWKTLDKLSNIFSSLSPGDSVLFRRGDVFEGTLIISKSGTSSSPIVLSAYGVGQKPILSGFKQLLTWLSEGGGVYSSNLLIRPNVVIINGAVQPISRYPRNSYKTIDAATSTSISDGSLLANNTNFSGGELVIRKERYIVDRHSIISQIGSILTFSPNGSGFYPRAGWGYFIQNHPSTLTTFGDWCHLNSKLYIFFGQYLPNNYLIKGSGIDTLLFIKNKNFITIDNLEFQGANITSIQLSGSSHVLIQNCRFDFAGKNSIVANSAPFLKIKDCLIANSLNDGIVADELCSNITISGNSILNTGAIIGMGQSGSGNYNAIQAFGNDGLIEYNRVDTTGGGGISFAGNNSTVQYNVVHHYAFVKDDAGGIYNGHGGGQVGKIIRNNIIYDAIGAGAGTPYANTSMAEGIYLDDAEAGAFVSNNTVFNCNDGIKMHNTNSIVIKNNICFGNSNAIEINHDVAGWNIRNLSIYKNSFVSKASHYALMFSTLSDDLRLFGMADSNFYARPITDNNVFWTHDPANNALWWQGSERNLAGWQALSGQDNNSKKSPKAVHSDDDVILKFNPSEVNMLIPLDVPYLGIDSTRYLNSLILPPFSSIVLIKDTSYNQNLTVTAGNDTAIFLPAPAIWLTGQVLNGSDTNINYRWTKIVGPNQYTLGSNSLPSTMLSNLSLGTYSFELQATTSQGAIGKDTVLIYVGNGILPIQLLNLAVSKEDGSNLVQWQTSEKNFCDFVVENSKEGQFFETVANLKANASEQNLRSFQFVDKYPFLNTNFYRIKKISAQGQVQYSNVVAVHSEQSPQFSFGRLSVVGKTLTLNISSGENKVVQFTLSDLLGNVFLSIPLMLKKGDNLFHQNISRPYRGSIIASVHVNGKSFTKGILAE